MYQSKNFYYGTGRRKKSVARVRLYNGNGRITVNSRSMDVYFGLETLKVIVKQPLNLTENLSKFDIICNVYGGGVSGQAGAIRHGISRALLEFNRDLKAVLKNPCPFLILPDFCIEWYRSLKEAPVETAFFQRFIPDCSAPFWPAPVL